MVGKKICLTVSEEVWNEMMSRAKAEGFSGVPALVRHLAVVSMNEQKGETSDRKVLKVTVDNYRELSGYVSEKKFGSVASFATFAMEATMQRNPLTAAQTARVAKLLG